LELPCTHEPTSGGVYALELERGNYYVGYTTNLRQRIQQHLDGTLAAGWTALHRPVGIAHIEPGASMIRETSLTLELMHEHGWQRVRSSQWVQADLVAPPHELEERV